MSRKEEIQQALNELPDNIKHTVENFNWSAEILAIARKYGIQIDDVNILKEETMLVIVGLERAVNYKDNLKRKMGISEELAEELVNESNTRIFEELQRRAFSKEQHEEVADTLKEEGIHLVDEDTPKTQAEGTNTPTSSKPQTPLYYEPITDDDYKGISGHRINTDFLSSSSQSGSQGLDTSLYHSTMVSKGDTVNVDNNDVEYFKKLKNTD